MFPYEFNYDCLGRPAILQLLGGVYCCGRDNASEGHNNRKLDRVLKCFHAA